MEIPRPLLAFPTLPRSPQLDPGRFVPNQWLWWFVPRDVVIPELTADRPFAVARHSTDVIGYNNKFYPDGCPITNIWQLTEPQYKGKFFMEDPMSDVSTMAKIAAFVQNADEMTTAYQSLYGRDWTTDELVVADTSGIKPENAGYHVAQESNQQRCCCSRRR